MKLLDQLGLQLYSVRDAAEKDFFGTIAEVAKMGYTGIEFAGYYDKPAAELKKCMDDNGLVTISAHVGPQLVFDADACKAQCEYMNVLGGKYIVVPFYPMKDRESTLACAEMSNKAVEICADYGIKLGYHNHAHEFAKDADGKYLMDIYLENTEPNVLFQFDIFWGGLIPVDVIEYLKKWYGRAIMVHLKQLAKIDTAKLRGEDGQIDYHKISGANCCAGDGVIDFAEVIKYGKYHNIDAFIYEQEEYEVSSLESAAKSAKYLLSLEEV